LVTGAAAVFAASLAACSACLAVAAAWVAAVFWAAVAPGAAAVWAAWVAACSACWACWVAWVAAVLLFRARVSATTWPDPAVEFVVAWQPTAALVQLPVEEACPVGGPREPVEPLTVFDPSLPIAVECTLPAHPAEPAWQSRVAVALDQLEAPGTVGATLAPAPGEPAGAGGVAGCCPPEPVPVVSPPLEPLPPCETLACPLLCPLLWPVVWEVVVAFGVEGAWTRGAILEASGPAEAPELVTAWHPPVAPWQVPVPVEPRGSGEMFGSVPVAELVTLPVQLDWLLQLSAAPEAEAADGPEPGWPFWPLWPPAR